MKRKLLSLAAALLCAVSIWADTVDCTSKMSNAQGDWTGASGTYDNGVAPERYNGDTTPFSTGDVLYQTITGLSNGYYQISFYAWENYANHAETDAIAYGNNIAQVFANTSVQDINVIKHKNGRDWNAANTYTLLATVTDGTLKYGVKNIASGGNWAVCRAISLTYLGTTADFTSLISNPSFETGDFTGWTAFGDNQQDVPVPTAQLVSEKPLTNASGDYVCNFQWWCWSNNPSIPNGISQNIGSLPAGKYRISAVLGAPNGWTVKLYANNESASSTMTSDYAGANLSKDITLDGSTNLTIKAIVAASVTAWEEVNMRVDNFKLYSLDHYYDALNAAISAAETHTLGFEDGEYAPYNNVAAITALNAAKAVNQANYDISWADLETIVSNLTSATWTANDGNVECVYNGNFAIGQGSPAANIQQYGWTRTNDWGQFRNDGYNSSTAYYNQPGSLQYGNAGVYTMPLKANTIYTLTFKYASWENNSNTGLTVSVLNGDNGMEAMNFDANGKIYNTEGAFVTKTLVFATGAAGNYVLTLANGGNTVMTDVSITKAANQYLQFADNSSVPSYAPGTYPSVKITRTLTAERWATAVYPFSVSTSATGIDDVVVLDSYNAETGALGFTSAASTANKPFLMRSTAGASEITLSNVEVAAASATDATAGKVSLKGTYTATNITNAEKNYVLSNNKIYSVGSEGATINPYRAYIQIDPSASVKALNFFIDGEDATGISAIDNGQLTIDNAVIYNVAGQRISKLQKGINIVNGKKILK